MVANDSLDRQFLEQTLQQHRETRRTFHRDLRIACGILAFFQILLFFRFLQLDNERLRLEEQLARSEKDRVALATVGTSLEAIGDSLDPLLVTLDQLPVFLRQQILFIEARRAAPAPSDCTDGFNCSAQSPIQQDLTQLGTVAPGYMASLSELAPAGTPTAALPVDAACTVDTLVGHSSPTLSSTATAIPMVTATVQSVAQEPPSTGTPLYDDFGAEALVSYLDGLPAGDQQLLSAGAPSEEYLALVESIVNETVVPALFVGLNARKDEILQSSFAGAREQLCTTLESNREAFERLGLAPDDILSRVDAAQAGLWAYRIAPPSDPSWWRAYPGKEDAASTGTFEVSDFSDQILASDAGLESVANEVLALINTLSERKVSVDDRIADTESQFDQARATFDQIAAPLPWVPIELRYAVLYYPLILAGVFFYFVLRYVTDRERARTIVHQAKAIGISAEVLDLYFADYSIPIANAGPNTRWNGVRLRPILTVAIFIPGIAFAVSVAMIVNSRGFVEDRSWYLALYAVSATFLILGYWQLFLSLRKKIDF
jgi:hypothetical protein